MEHHVMLVLNRAAGTHQARAHVPGGLGSRRQVSVPLYPKVVTAAPKAVQAGTVPPIPHCTLKQVRSQLPEWGVAAHTLQI